jgi:hypothetical protein
MFAILGWLTIHFTLAYIGPDPFGADAGEGGSRSHYEL